MKTNPLDRLCALVAPPADPLYNRGDWEAVELELGLRLPEDYKRLIETFGQGGFVGRVNHSGILIFSYLVPGRAVERAEGFSAYIRTIEPMPYGIYPDKPGLLGCGSYADKDTIAWNTTGEPENWTLVFHDPESGLHEVREMGIVDFISSVLEETSPLHKNGVIRMGNMTGPHTFRPEP